MWEVGAPTLERPFGVHLWPIFDSIFTSLAGFSANDWDIQEGVTPLTRKYESIGIILAYYLILFVGQRLMKDRRPIQLPTTFMIHNLVLTIVSLVLASLYIEQQVAVVVKHGVYYSVCAYDGGIRQPMQVLSYLNYITKYVELFDTLFLVAKKKPLTFLHTFHHGATAFLCCLQVTGETPICWLPITLNLIVHIVMYYYFFRSASGARVWWKQWVTKIQIIQFIIDLCFIYFAGYSHVAATYFPLFPNAGTCDFQMGFSMWGGFLISSYLVLFISFYTSTYGDAPKKVVSEAEKPAVSNTTPVVRSRNTPFSQSLSTATSYATNSEEKK